MPTLKEKLGARIKYLRKELGYSQEKLAEIIDMDILNLSNIERGKHFMTAETLEKIAYALRTTERDLFDFGKSHPQQYVRSDIYEMLDSLSDKELDYFKNILLSYQNFKEK